MCAPCNGSPHIPIQSPYRNTCLTVLSEGGKLDLSNYLCCCELVLSVHPSLTSNEVCNLFPSCVIQCGAALFSPEEHKQLPAPLIHTGALNSFYAQHPTQILREIICMSLPAARLILLADLLCFLAASGHIVLFLSDDIWLLTAFLRLDKSSGWRNSDFFIFALTEKLNNSCVYFKIYRNVLIKSRENR